MQYSKYPQCLNLIIPGIFFPLSFLLVLEPLLYQELQNLNCLKNKLFEVLYAEPVDTMKKHIADTLGEIAGSVIGSNPESWPEFKINLWELFKQ